MSETTAPTGGSNVLNDNKQQELYVKRCHDVFENMSKAGYGDVVLNIMEARMKPELQIETNNPTDSTTSGDATANNDKKKETTLLIGGLPYKKMPFEPYINLLKTNPEFFSERGVKVKEKEIESTTKEQTNDGPQI